MLSIVVANERSVAAANPQRGARAEANRGKLMRSGTSNTFNTRIIFRERSLSSVSRCARRHVTAADPDSTSASSNVYHTRRRSAVMADPALLRTAPIIIFCCIGAVSCAQTRHGSEYELLTRLPWPGPDRGDEASAVWLDVSVHDTNNGGSVNCNTMLGCAPDGSGVKLQVRASARVREGHSRSGAAQDAAGLLLDLGGRDRQSQWYLETVTTRAEATEVWHYDVPPTPFNSAQTTPIDYGSDLACVASDVPTDVSHEAPQCDATSEVLFELEREVSLSCVGEAPFEALRLRSFLSRDYDAPDAPQLRVPLSSQADVALFALPSTLADENGVVDDALEQHVRAELGRVAARVEGKRRTSTAAREVLSAEQQIVAKEYAAHATHPWLAEAVTSSPGAYERLLEPDLGAALRTRDVRRLLSLVRLVSPSGVWAFEVFPPHVREALMEEISSAHQSDIEFTRPNSMNYRGLVLEEIGLQPLLDSIVSAVMAPLATLLLPQYEVWPGSLDHNHGFTISYAREGPDDIKLDSHMDDSEVTLNVCLGDDFTDGSVFFGPARDHPNAKQFEGEGKTIVPHVPGFGLLHAGQHFHGAHQIGTGRRVNVVAWARSSSAFASTAEHLAERCSGDEPQFIEL